MPPPRPPNSDRAIPQPRPCRSSNSAGQVRARKKEQGRPLNPTIPACQGPNRPSNACPTTFRHYALFGGIRERSAECAGSRHLARSGEYSLASPDVTTEYLLNGPLPHPPHLFNSAFSPSVQPRDVTDGQSKTFGDACEYGVTFTSTDDDEGRASDEVQVIITGTAG